MKEHIEKAKMAILNRIIKAVENVDIKMPSEDLKTLACIIKMFDEDEEVEEVIQKEEPVVLRVPLGV